MMHYNDAFPSKYLRAADLRGRDIEVTISEVHAEKIGDSTKLVLAFEDKPKEMVCNKTNAKVIAKFYGGEVDEWIGKKIILYTATVDFKGDMVEAIRVKVPTEAAIEDEVPF